MASRPLDHNSTNGSTGLDDILVTPEELHRNDAPDNMDGLELFTNTLFWDLDLARFLDGVDYSRDVGDSTALGSSSNNGSKSYGGSGLSGFEEDFFNGTYLIFFFCFWLFFSLPPNHIIQMELLDWSTSTLPDCLFCGRGPCPIF
jgi:hypothetical protein